MSQDGLPLMLARGRLLGILALSVTRNAHVGMNLAWSLRKSGCEKELSISSSRRTSCCEPRGIRGSSLHCSVTDSKTRFQNPEELAKTGRWRRPRMNRTSLSSKVWRLHNSTGRTVRILSAALLYLVLEFGQQARVLSADGFQQARN